MNLPEDTGEILRRVAPNKREGRKMVGYSPWLEKLQNKQSLSLSATGENTSLEFLANMHSTVGKESMASPESDGTGIRLSPWPPNPTSSFGEEVSK